ncbi:MAG TPA: hypothetical protein VNJ08_02245 [Bacteriovoracaceae bacterium]|nr:hypothetical protein [Bacteriovoracaceae bacterium]
MLKALTFCSLLVAFTTISYGSSDKIDAFPAIGFDINLKLENFNVEQEEKVLKAADLIKRVVVSEEFKNAILNHTYRGEKTFAENNGLTNEQIYQKILEGSEDLRPGADNKMDMDLEVYFEDTITVGYTRPSVFKVWMNSKYLNKNGPAEVTTNMMHEWLHKLGFKHDLKHSDRRMNTVPYAIGYLMERLAKKMYNSRRPL